MTTRPGPGSPQISSKALHPIYSALDSRNYTKALKLTASPAGEAASWDIVRALRVHALERSGKRREALLLLWDLLAGTTSSADADHGGDVWWELADRIEVMSNAADLVDGSCSPCCAANLLDTVQRMDRACFAIEADAAGLGVASGDSNAVASGTQAGKSQPKSAAKGKGKKSKDSSSAVSNNNKAKQPNLPPITDETVLQTIAVTLKTEGLYDTMSEMYHQAVLEGSKHQSTSNAEQQNEFANVLQEATCVHFKAVADCPAIPKDKDSYTFKDLQMQHRQTRYYERMQSTSLQLAKYTGEALHFQWTAISSLWYKESLEVLVVLMQYFHQLISSTEDENALSNDEEKKRMKGWLVKILNVESVNDIPSKCTTYQQKMGLLPRLAESLSYRMIQNKLQDGSDNSVNDGHRRQHYAPSEADWDVYLETLLAQNKLEEALEALRGMNCSPLVMDGGGGIGGSSENGIPQIHDEHTIENHVGTILPYTQRKKLEQMSQIGSRLSRFNEVEGWYKELLRVFPDQWTYWMGLIDSSALVNGTVDEDGWCRCRTFGKEIMSSNDALRGPHLFFVELVAVKLRHLTGADEVSKTELLVQLRKAICDYGDKFSSIASCCFSDLRPYLELLVRSNDNSATDGNISEDVALVMKWAKGLWMIHSQSSSGQSVAGGDASPDELRERRKKLRTYIFSVQVCYCLAAELGKANQCDNEKISTLTMELLQNYTPPMEEMISEWRTSLEFLPGIPPKDGGQKETLPGDEIALLLTQCLQFKASCDVSAASSEKHLIAAAGLLEEAIEHSPYNPSLKIAAIGVYSNLKAAHRAFEHYKDLGVKYIQLDSCSFLILPVLLQGGLYTQAAQLSSSLIRFHGSTSKDVKDYSSKSFQKGYMLKAKEMVSFQTQKMHPSVQLLQAKGCVMDCAALLNASDLVDSKQKTEIRLGAEQGLCGCDEDVARAEQLVKDAEGHFNVPSIIHSSSNVAFAGDFTASDNRDMTVNYFEILHNIEHSSEIDVVNEALLKGHTQGLLIRAIMAADAAKAPKKGKVPKNSDVMSLRCKSLLLALQRAKQFVDSGGVGIGQVDKPIWEATCSLCNVIVGVIQGTGDSDPKDSLADREKNATTTIGAATSFVSEARVALSTAAGDAICKLLPDRIVPLCTLIETTGRVFALFGWGKRKRTTKDSAGALANLALSFKDFLSDMLHIMKQYRAFDSSIPLDSVQALDIGTDHLHKAVRHIVSSRNMTIDRVDVYLLQMIRTMETYANEESNE